MAAEAVNIGTIYAPAELRLGSWNAGFAKIAADAAVFRSLKLATTPTLDAGKFGAGMNALKASTTATLSAIKTQFSTHNAQTLAAAQSHAKAISRAAEDEKVGVLRAARSRIAEEKSLTTSGKLAIIHEAQDRARQISRAAADEKAAVLLQARETTAGLKQQAEAQARNAKEAQAHAAAQMTQRKEARGQITQGAIVGAGAAGAALLTEAGAAANVSGRYDRLVKYAGTNMDYSPAQIEAMNRRILNVSKDPRILQKPTELADAMYAITSTPLFAQDPARADQMLKFAAYAATAGSTNVKSAAMPALAAMESRIKGSETPEKTLNTIFQGVKTGQMEYGQLGDIGDMLVQARLMGRNLNEVMADMSMITVQGIKPDQASTFLQNFYREIRGASPAAAATMDALGIKHGAHAMDQGGMAGWLEDARKRMQARAALAEKDPRYRTIEHGKTGTRPVTSVEDLTKLIVPEMRGETGLDLLIGNLSGPTGKPVKLDSSQYRFFLNQMTGSNQGGGALNRSLDIMSTGPAAAMDRLAKSFERVQISLGKGITPAMEAFAGWIEKVIAAFDKLTPKQQAGVGTGIAVIGGALTIGAVVGQFALSLAGLSKVFEGTKVAASVELMTVRLGGFFGLLSKFLPLLSPHISAPGGYSDKAMDFAKKVQEWFGGSAEGGKGGAGGVKFSDPTRGDSSAGLRSTLEARSITALSQGVTTPLGEASCAYFASQLLQKEGIKVPKTAGAKALRDRFVAMGGQAVPDEQRREGDLVVWRGARYGAAKFNEGGERVGYHVGVVDERGGVRQSSGGHVSSQPFYDAAHATVYRMDPNAVTPAAGTEDFHFTPPPDPNAKKHQKAARTNQQIADEMIGVGGDAYLKDVSSAVRAFHAKLAAGGDYNKAMAEMNARLSAAKAKDDERFEKELTRIVTAGAKEREKVRRHEAQEAAKDAKIARDAWADAQSTMWESAMDAQRDITEGEFGPGVSLKEREKQTREMQEAAALQHEDLFGQDQYGPALTFKERERQREEMWQSGADQHAARFGEEEYGPALSEKTKKKQAGETARAFKNEWGSTMREVEGGFEHFAAAAFKHVHSVGSLWQEFVHSMREVFINAIAQMAARWATAAIFGGNKGPLGTLGVGGGGGGLFGGLGSLLGGLGGLFGGHRGAAAGDAMGPVSPGSAQIASELAADTGRQAGGGAGGGLGGIGGALGMFGKGGIFHLGGGLAGLGAAMPWIGGGLVLNQLMGNPLGKVFKGIKRLFHFDDPVNDRKAEKWGFDFAQHFASGAEGSWDRRAAFGQDGKGGGSGGNTTNGGHTVNVHLHGSIHGVEDVHQTFKDAAQHVHSQLAVVTPI